MVPQQAMQGLVQGPSMGPAVAEGSDHAGNAEVQQVHRPDGAWAPIVQGPRLAGKGQMHHSTGAAGESGEAAGCTNGARGKWACDPPACEPDWP